MQSGMKAMILPALLGALALAACGKTEPEPVSTTSTATSTTTSPPKTTPAAIPAAASAATATPPKPSGPLASTVHPDLLDPSKLTAKAPDVFKAKLTTTKGDIVIQVHRDWAPNGADRFYNLVKSGFYDDVRIFRVVNDFMAQVGLSGDPAVTAKWTNASIPDDPDKGSNKRGYVTFAQTGSPNSRTTQFFINYTDQNTRLDATHFVPFGQVVQGMDVADSLFKGYGEAPNQALIQQQGNAYLDLKFPNLDSIKHAAIVP